jgi:hypothetical protein
VLEAWNLFSFMNLCILDSYCSVGRMTKELPLSAFAIIALLILISFWVEFISTHSVNTCQVSHVIRDLVVYSNNNCI